MAIKSEAEALSTSSELLTTATNGHSDAPTGLIIWNDDASITVYVGGSDVSTANGMPILAQTYLSMDLMAGDEVYMIAASGTPSVRFLYTRV